MADHLNFPPPTGPRVDAEPQATDVWTARRASDARAQVPDVETGDAWAAPVGAPPSAPPRARAARAITVEGLDLAVPEVTGTVVLDIPDAAKPVALTNLNGLTTKVLVGGRPVRVGAFAKVKFPLKDGTQGSLRIGGISGYPVVRVGNKVIYRHPRPQGWEWGLLVATVAVPIVALGIGVIPALIGFGCGMVHVRLIKSGAATWVRVVVPSVVLAGWVMVGVYVYSHLGELSGRR